MRIITKKEIIENVKDFIEARDMLTAYMNGEELDIDIDEEDIEDTFETEAIEDEAIEDVNEEDEDIRNLRTMTMIDIANTLAQAYTELYMMTDDEIRPIWKDFCQGVNCLINIFKELSEG